MRRPPFTPRKIPRTHFCQRLSPPQGHSAAGLGQLKNTMTSSGIDPATFRLVPKFLNQLRYRVPPHMEFRWIYILWGRGITNFWELSLSTTKSPRLGEALTTQFPDRVLHALVTSRNVLELYPENAGFEARRHTDYPEFFRGLSQSLEINSAIVPRFGHGHFL
jgi:hypothetical protein